eukprot:1305908-Heterocapsa_arctica.AAC.1
MEDDSGYHTSHHSSSGEEEQTEELVNMEERAAWMREDTITAEFIEELTCMHLTGRDMELMEDEAGKGEWTICRNP